MRKIKLKIFGIYILYILNVALGVGVYLLFKWLNVICPSLSAYIVEFIVVGIVAYQIARPHLRLQQEKRELEWKMNKRDFNFDYDDDDEYDKFIEHIDED